MKDNLRRVVIYSPKGSRDREVKRRILGGKFIENSIVILSKDEIPFKKVRYRVVGFDADGTPRITIV